MEPEHRGEHGGDGRLRRAPSPATHSRPCPAIQWENQTEALFIYQKAPALAEPTRGGGRGVLAWGRELARSPRRPEGLERARAQAGDGWCAVRHGASPASDKRGEYCDPPRGGAKFSGRRRPDEEARRGDGVAPPRK